MKYLEKFSQLVKKIFKNKKNVYVFCGIFILVIVAFSVRSILFKKDIDPILENIYDLNKPILKEEEEGVYTYVSDHGKKVIDAVYTYASPFYGMYAAVSTDDNNKDVLTYDMIDRNGVSQIQIESDDPPKYYKDYGIWQIGNSLYDYSLKPLFSGNFTISYIGKGYFYYLDNDSSSSGIIDKDGKKTFELESDYITVSISNSKYFMDTYGIVSDYENIEYIINLQNGNIIFELKDTESKYLRECDDNIFRIIDRENNYKTERWLYIENDKIVFDTKESIYDVSFKDLKDKILTIDYGPSYESLGHKTRETFYSIEESKFLNKYSGSKMNDRALMMEKLYKLNISLENKKYGLKKNGNAILDENYDHIEFVDLDLFEYLKIKYKKEIVLLTKNRKTSLYDIKHKKDLFTFESDAVEEVGGTPFFIATTYKEDGYSKDEYIIFNVITNKRINIKASSSIKIYSNYLIETKNGKETYYNSKLEKID